MTGYAMTGQLRAVSSYQLVYFMIICPHKDKKNPKNNQPKKGKIRVVAYSFTDGLLFEEPLLNTWSKQLVCSQSYVLDHETRSRSILATARQRQSFYFVLQGYVCK